jgi:glycosyltransferase involved in cell wall biosynthesis
MRLDLVVATFRRPELLADTLRSIFAAGRPARLDLRVIIVNNDRETDLAVVQPLLASAPVPVLLLHEPRRGKSHALNLAIRSSDADYIGFVDDDERVAPDWFAVAHDALAEGRLDFIGGPMRPVWPSAAPDWIPRSYPAVLGIVDNGAERTPYRRDFPGMLVGGNAIVRRTCLESIGGFSTDLGPQEGHRLMSCEDEDVYQRLLQAGASGEYVPQLVVHHHVHESRLRKSYYRSWCFWNGASKAVLDRRRPAGVPTIGGVPRYVYGVAVRAAGTWMKACLTNRGPAARLEAELPFWHLAGHLYGRHGLRQQTRSETTADRVERPLTSSRRP